MTDAITLLTSDHRTVETLFQQAESAPSPSSEVVDRIVKELSVHDAVEREYLYPAVRESVPSGAGLSDHSVEEHNEVAETLLAIDKADNGSGEQKQLLARLVTLVRAHVEEEETRVFPAMRSALTPEDLEELGGKLERAKSTAPTRPHPHAPDQGLGTKIAGAVSAPLDKARDAAQGRS